MLQLFNPARKDEDIYAVLVHEFTHYMAVSYKNEKVEEFMKELIREINTKEAIEKVSSESTKLQQRQKLI